MNPASILQETSFLWLDRSGGDYATRPVTCDRPASPDRG